GNVCRVTDTSNCEGPVGACSSCSGPTRTPTPTATPTVTPGIGECWCGDCRDLGDNRCTTRPLSICNADFGGCGCTNCGGGEQTPTPSVTATPTPPRFSAEVYVYCRGATKDYMVQ